MPQQLSRPYGLPRQRRQRGEPLEEALKKLSAALQKWKSDYEGSFTTLVRKVLDQAKVKKTSLSLELESAKMSESGLAEGPQLARCWTGLRMTVYRVVPARGPENADREVYVEFGDVVVPRKDGN